MFSCVTGNKQEVNDCAVDYVQTGSRELTILQSRVMELERELAESREVPRGGLDASKVGRIALILSGLRFFGNHLVKLHCCI